MQATDFIYDGQWLSDLGFMICTFDSSEIENTSAGSNITFNTVKQHSGTRFAQTSCEYEESFTTTFDICKNNDKDGAGMDITLDEYRYLMRWLNRREYCTFSLVDRYDDEWNSIYFEGSFNVERVNFAGRLIGLSLTFYSNRPFGFGEPITKTITLNGYGYDATIRNESDELGVLYPELVKIYCVSSGTVAITNNLDGSIVTILNCSSGETITMDCANQIISTSNTGHKIHNDFNYTFFRLYSTSTERDNVYTSINPCTVTVTYRPIRKVVF